MKHVVLSTFISSSLYLLLFPYVSFYLHFYFFISLSIFISISRLLFLSLFLALYFSFHFHSYFPVSLSLSLRFVLSPSVIFSVSLCPFTTSPFTFSLLPSFFSYPNPPSRSLFLSCSLPSALLLNLSFPFPLSPSAPPDASVSVLCTNYFYNPRGARRIHAAWPDAVTRHEYDCQSQRRRELLCFRGRDSP